MRSKPDNLPPKDLLAALLVIVLWGLNFVPMKYALQDFTPFQLGAARFACAAFPLILFVPRPNIPFRWLLMFAVTQGVGQFSLLFFALHLGMTAALASVIMQTQIFLTAIMAATLLGETLSRALKAGMVIAAAGLVCFAVDVFHGHTFGALTAVAFVINLGAAAMWASSNIVVRKLTQSGCTYTPLSLVAWASLVSAALFAIIALVETPSLSQVLPRASWGSWVSVLYLGWIANGVAYWLWAVLLTRHPASRVAPFSLGIPIVGIFAGILVLDETVSDLQWTGVTLVMTSLAVVIIGSLRAIRLLGQRYRRSRR